MAKTDNPVAEAVDPMDAERRTLPQDEQLDRFRQTIEQIGERNRDEDPDDVLRFVTEVVEEVRQEQDEAAQRRHAEERRRLERVR